MIEWSGQLKRNSERHEGLPWRKVLRQQQRLLDLTLERVRTELGEASLVRLLTIAESIRPTTYPRRFVRWAGYLEWLDDPLYDDVPPPPVLSAGATTALREARLA